MKGFSVTFPSIKEAPGGICSATFCLQLPSMGDALPGWHAGFFQVKEAAAGVVCWAGEAQKRTRALIRPTHVIAAIAARRVPQHPLLARPHCILSAMICQGRRCPTHVSWSSCSACT